jgi:hypothetical protein
MGVDMRGSSRRDTRKDRVTPREGKAGPAGVVVRGMYYCIRLLYIIVYYWYIIAKEVWGSCAAYCARENCSMEYWKGSGWVPGGGLFVWWEGGEGGRRGGREERREGGRGGRERREGGEWRSRKL